ncbi:MAG TPA: pentapeptide repeat-containing protein [Methanocorpusculum sp.]|nr:pentapeptide repeat-containing protein [Methanocorpusculum sp.]
MSEKDTPPGSNGLFDQEQYDWLLRCVHLAIVEKRQKRLVPGETHDIPEIKLAGANLAKLNLRDIQLQLANLGEANLREAHL